MSEIALFNMVLLPIGLGLLGFAEPCSMGGNLLFIKYLEGKSRKNKIVQIGAFMLSRACFIGALGVLAAFIGMAFITIQQILWILLGSLYLIIGALYLAGHAEFLMRTLGPGLARATKTRGPVALGILFGLNVPACAAPMLFVLFGTAVLGGATMAQGFLALGLFGLALSAPLALAVLWPTGQRFADRLAALSSRMPRWTGIMLVALGLWSIYFALFVKLEAWL